MMFYKSVSIYFLFKKLVHVYLVKDSINELVFPYKLTRKPLALFPPKPDIFPDTVIEKGFSANSTESPSCNI